MADLKLVFSRNNGIDIIKFDVTYKLVRCSNARMMRCVGQTYCVSLINGRLSAMDTVDLSGEGSRDFHTSTVLEITSDSESLVVRTSNSVYEFVREA